jgi:hypothetical protein
MLSVLHAECHNFLVFSMLSVLHAECHNFLVFSMLSVSNKFMMLSVKANGREP